MASPIEGLKREHRAIEAAIGSLGELCVRMERGEAPKPELLDLYIDFIRRFADGCHHHKEELVLFPALVERGFPGDAGPIGCMLSDHESGRAFVRRMAAAVKGMRHGDAAAKDEFMEAAAGYSQLLTNHIYKEDNVLFRMAECLLGDTVLSSLQPSFEAAEAELGAAKYEEYEAWAQGLVGAISG